MTTELEERFFKTFGIEPISKWHKCEDYNCICCDEYEFCYRREFVYPKITDKVLLKLICIAYSTYDINLTIEEIKENILQNLIESKDEVKHRIQQLYKGEK